MPVRIPCTLLLGFLLLAVSTTRAQEAPPAAAPAPKKAEFDRIFTEWKALLTEMRDLKEEFRTAGTARGKEILEQYPKLIAKGDAMQPQLIAAAAEAFAEAPNADDELATFLMGIVTWQCANDEYEEALSLAQTLIESKIDNKAIDAWAGLAAFAVGEFDDAEKHLKTAKENDVLRLLAERGEMYLALCPYYKEAWAKEQQARAAEAEADDLPRVLLTTNKGPIEVELLENEAPNTVANFISLVEQEYYDGLTFHRVLPGFMAQGGCPTGTGTGGPGYNIPCECYLPNHRLHFRGSLSMAHAGRDTGGSQFFLNFVPTRQLDGKHTVFGRVVKGFDVLGKIQRRDPEAIDPPAPDKILEAKVLRKREHEYVPKKTGE
jgi:cyclophilin family peptidyl-prolyl cis-trans isomerase